MVENGNASCRGKTAVIIGAGLAGSEAAWQLALRGVHVTLCEMRPQRMTKAHRTPKCAELVCSNSFRGAALTNAVGLLKEELRLCGSLIMQAADAAKVPAGGALAVDREVFSDFVHSRISSHPLISLVRREIGSIPEATVNRPLIIASGPLTSPALAASIEALLGGSQLAFFDAISPIVLGNSIDLTQIFRASRYGKGGGEDYLNIALTKEQYEEFVDDILKAEKFGGHDEVESDCVDSLRPFEGCMPIEEMAARGPDTLRYGPLKPTGLRDPRSGNRPHAVIQLRQDNLEGTLWSMVGFQTKMKHSEQRRVFTKLPGLEKAEFVRLGSVHRNTFINAPKFLSPSMELRSRQGLFFAGQITGVEGYVESTAAGLVAGLSAFSRLNGIEPQIFPTETAIGALMSYVSDPNRTYFQPMNISFGLMPSYAQAVADRKVSKDALREQTSLRSLEIMRKILNPISTPIGTTTVAQPSL